MKYKVNEIFYSVQGEGLYTGQPMVFVRLAKCNLACPWCDTEFEKYVEMDEDEIAIAADEVQGMHHPKIVCFTGGEPTLQLNETLIEAFLNRGWRLHAETNGIKPIFEFLRFDCVTISPKTRLSETLRREWRALLSSADPTTQFVLKIVCDHGEQFDVDKAIDDWDTLPFNSRYLQPLMKEGETNEEEVTMRVLRDPRYRISLQTQKILRVR